MTVEQYFALCAGFDWYYEFTDDYGVWQMSKKAHNNLMRWAEHSLTFMKLYTAWKQYMFSGSNFGTEQKPEPLLEDFL